MSDNHSDPWLLVDVFNLGYRALFTQAHNLECDGVIVGSIYGVFNQIVALTNQFQTPNICWCFDYGKPLRASVLPEYKGNRHKDQKPEEIEKREQMKRQMHALRLSILKDIGFGNVFYAKGYEADDIIASLCINSIPTHREVIIVSGDEDMYQLLSPSISIWQPNKKKLVTQKSFLKEWGIDSAQWPDVKAIAGCASDNVPGVKGVAEKTAIKYLGGTLKPNSKAFEAIVKTKYWERNLPLVTLPYKGCPTFKRKRDHVTAKSWMRVMKQFRFETLYRSWNF